MSPERLWSLFLVGVCSCLISACTLEPGGDDDDSVASDDDDSAPGDDDDSAPGDDDDSAAEAPVDTDEDGFSKDEDCDDNDPAVNSAAEEICDGKDNDCDGDTDESDAVDARIWYLDGDGDGFGDDGTARSSCDSAPGETLHGGDCDDQNPAFHPGASESDCTDPADYNCDGSVGHADIDGDGSAACEDCDDTNDTIHLAQTESCDGVDNDCDDLIDEAGATGETLWYLDADGDGYGRSATSTLACAAPTAYVADSNDCDDLNASSYPGAVEVCDGADNNCDTQIDEGAAAPGDWYADADGDGFGNALSSTVACVAPFGTVADGTDCNDLAPTVNPNAAEVCDGTDNNCDTQTDEGVLSTWYSDSDGDGFGNSAAAATACTAPAGYVSDLSDCDDLAPGVHPAATEVCDGDDNNCDTQIDEGVLSTWYADSDLDGFGDSSVTATACTAPPGYTSDASDCDDLADYSYPDATELCDSEDNDCNNTVDDGEALGDDQACPATDCADIRDNNPASADGLWWVDPNTDGAFEVWCDQTTDGGGWNIVWKNHGGARGGEISNATLLSNANSALGTAAVTDHLDDLVSAINQRAYDVWWTSPNREWLKKTTLWDNSDAIENQQHIRLNMNSVTMAEVFSIPVTPCHTASGTIEVTVNDTISFSSTNLINHYWEGTYGLANTGNGGADACGQTSSNLIDDPAANTDTLYRIDNPSASLNGIRHLFSYVHESADRDTSRCLYACWDSSSHNGHYDGFSWGVR